MGDFAAWESHLIMPVLKEKEELQRQMKLKTQTMEAEFKVEC